MKVTPYVTGVYDTIRALSEVGAMSPQDAIKLGNSILVDSEDSLDFIFVFDEEIRVAKPDLTDG
jgi:hypothetical protein